MRLAAAIKPLRALALFATLAAVFAVYWPGIDGPMVFDDYHNIGHNQAVQPAQLDSKSIEYAARSYGDDKLVRGGAMLSFAAQYYLRGGKPTLRDFKVVNVAIHVVNALLVFLLARGLAASWWRRRLDSTDPGGAVDSARASFWIGVGAAAVWGLHPINLTAVLYIVQRMTSLSATCMLAGLLCFVAGRTMLLRRPVQGLLMMSLGPVFAGVIGLLFKETAASIFLLLPVIEYAFFTRSDPFERRVVKWFQLIYFVLPLTIVVAMLVLAWDSLNTAYLQREFSMQERLLTEPRILWFYIKLFAVPDLTAFALFHDVTRLSSSWLSPPSTALSIGAWAVLASWSLLRLRQGNLLAFAVLWFLACHLLESSFVALELVFEHRNYLAGVGLAIALAIAAARVTAKNSGLTRRLLGGAFVTVVSLCALVTSVRADIWSDHYEILSAGARNYPGSWRYRLDLANYELRFNGNIDRGLTLLKETLELRPTEFAASVEMYQLLVSEEFRALNLGDQTHDGAVAANVSRRPAAAELRALADGVSATLTERLATFPVGASGLAALQRAAECAADGDVVCRAEAETYARWLAAAAGRESNIPRNLGIAWRLVSLLERTKGDIDGALAAMDRAVEASPSTSAYVHFAIQIAIDAGRLEEAEQRIAQARRDDRGRPAALDWQKREIARLRDGAAPRSAPWHEGNDESETSDE